MALLHATPTALAAALFRTRWTPLALCTALWIGPASAVAQQGASTTPPAPAERGTELRVWLVTTGPGDAVWERYGHNAIRVLDTRTGRDVSYNWGIFDFRQVDFIPRFLQGRMLYMMAPFSTPAMVDAYARANREVVFQELDLTPAEKAELRDLAEVNALPQNRNYTYQYFLDNCSTRVRDLLDRVLDGRLREEFAGVATGTSYRFHTRRLTQVDPLVYTGMDLLLGAPTDREISVWEEMFLPLTVRDEIRSVRVVRADGTVRPLVRSEEVVVASTRPPPPAAPPHWLPIYGLIGLLLGGVLAVRGSARVRSRPLLRRLVVAVGTLWALLGSVAGTILVLLLFTDHTFAYWNENLFLVNPLMLGLVVAVPFAELRPLWLGRARRLAMILAVIALLGLVWQIAPASTHRNAIFFALFLPANLGLAYGLSRARRLETASGGDAAPHGAA